MMTHSDSSRVRRQMQRRIRVILAQRRLDPPDPPGAARTPRPPAEPPAGPEPHSAEPAPED
jgi:hypothetical protein